MSSGYELGVGISEEHEALARSVARFAERHLTRAVLRTSVEARCETLPAYWEPLVPQGLLGLHVDQHQGGEGGGLVELAVALEVIGRTAAPGPLVPTLLASALLAASQAKAAVEMLPGLVDGSRRGAVGLGAGILAEPDGSGAVTIRGTSAVVGGALAEVLLLPTGTGAGRRWVVVEATDCRVRRTGSMDVARPTVTVAVEALTVGRDRILDDLEPEMVESIAAVVLGAEAVGVASWCVQTAAEYARTRVQFGRPIGQFQGVKHRCARMAIDLEQARAAVWDAARAIDAGDPDAAFAAMVARAMAPDTAVRAARDCMQVLGGIGYTWEHDAHLYYRRGASLRAMLGRSRDCLGELATRALAGELRNAGWELPSEADEIRHSLRGELEEIAHLEPPAQPPRLGDGGWVLPYLPPPSGRGAGPLEQVVIAEEIKRAGVSLPELALAAWLMPSIVIHGTEEQRRELVAPTLRGEILWCQMFSEPDAGSDLASLRTRATRVDGGWRVNGQKVWTSLGFLAQWGVLLARTDPDAPKHEGITYFVVKMDTPGITVRPLREASGGTLFSEIFFDEVFIPDSGVVGAVNEGWQVARGTLANERVSLGKGTSLNATIDDLLAFARSRDPEDLPLETVGGLMCDSHLLGLVQTRTLLRQLEGQDTAGSASVAKYLNMRFGQRVADFCHAELGPDGLYGEADPQAARWIEQTVSSRAMTVYGGTSEIQLNVIAERVLGLPRDPEPAPARAAAP